MVRTQNPIKGIPVPLRIFQLVPSALVSPSPFFSTGFSSPTTKLRDEAGGGGGVAPAGAVDGGRGPDAHHLHRRARRRAMERARARRRYVLHVLVHQ
jgi:hypothetical protein